MEGGLSQWEVLLPSVDSRVSPFGAFCRNRCAGADFADGMSQSDCMSSPYSRRGSGETSGCIAFRRFSLYPGFATLFVQVPYPPSFPGGFVMPRLHDGGLERMFFLQGRTLFKAVRSGRIGSISRRTRALPRESHSARKTCS